MPTAQTLIDYRLCASVGIAPENAHVARMQSRFTQNRQCAHRERIGPQKSPSRLFSAISGLRAVDRLFGSYQLSNIPERLDPAAGGSDWRHSSAEFRLFGQDGDFLAGKAVLATFWAKPPQGLKPA
jgi:hypothetical protein